MERANTQVRIAAKEAGVPLWLVARGLGISEATMTRMLRKELASADKERVLRVINELGGERVE